MIYFDIPEPANDNRFRIYLNENIESLSNPVLSPTHVCTGKQGPVFGIFDNALISLAGLTGDEWI